ncbi:MAG TPA: long-chain fatty acid--CoA ligase [Thermoplasmata archaeon]|nr:long-chain fatty acid--CoA ligase [Thermoplasmata archaeon]
MSASSGAPPSPPWLAHYPEYVPRDLSIPDLPVPGLLEESAGRWPSRTALIFHGRSWSYSALWELSGHVAGNLAKAGARPGDKWALQLPNCPAYPAAFFGALRAGLQIVQVSPLYLGQDLERVLSDSGATGILTLDVLYPNLRAVRPKLPRLERVYVAHLAEFYPAWLRPFVALTLRRRHLSTEKPPAQEARSWRELLVPAAPPNVAIDPARTVAVYQYTGGTTGIPKAAMLTHRNLVANALQCRAWFAIQPLGTSVTLASVPFFHVYGLTVALTYPISAGSTIVLQLRPEVPEILKLIRKHHPTEFPAVPALYAAIAAHPKLPTRAIRSIQVCVSGSAPLPAEVAKRFEALTGGYLVEGYGLSEASPVTHCNPIRGQRKAGSIGVPLPLTEQRVVDLDTGSTVLPTGETGELAVRGPQIMLGYYGHPEESAAALRDGWLLTGDIATLDAEGYAFIVDRKKDIVIVGGLKVYPREVEEVLFQHPQVAEAAAFGAPDPELGEIVAAAVVRRPSSAVTEAELIAFVRERIAHYKAPRRIAFKESLPRSAVQKVLRRALREELLAARSGAAAGAR